MMQFNIAEILFKVLLESFKTNPYLWIFILAITLLLVSLNIIPLIIKISRYKKAGLEEIDKMTGAEFEEFLGTLYKKLGYSVEILGHSGDFGADLLVSKDGIKTVIQAKRWNYGVDLKAVQEVIGSIKYYNADKGMVVTNSYFKSSARKLAQKNSIELIDRDKLSSLIIQKQSV